MTSAGRLAAPVLFALLVLATMAAFVVVEDERDHPQIIGDDKLTPKFEPQAPRGSQPRRRMRVQFTITRAEPRATVLVLDAEGVVAGTLADAVPLEDDGEYEYLWDGRLDSGEPAPAGEYTVLVKLDELDRELPLDGRAKLVRTPEGES